MTINELYEGFKSAIDEKERDADQLDRWAKQSISGGWSTHQVEPMRKKADQLRREASQMRAVMSSARQEARC